MTCFKSFAETVTVAICGLKSSKKVRLETATYTLFKDFVIHMPTQFCRKFMETRHRLSALLNMLNDMSPSENVLRAP